MIEAALEGLYQVLTPNSLALMCLGVLLGSLVGFLARHRRPEHPRHHAALRDDDERPLRRHRFTRRLRCRRQYRQRLHRGVDLRPRRLRIAGHGAGRISASQAGPSHARVERVLCRFAGRRSDRSRSFLLASLPFLRPHGVVLRLAGIFHADVFGVSPWSAS